MALFTHFMLLNIWKNKLSYNLYVSLQGKTTQQLSTV